MVLPVLRPDASSLVLPGPSVLLLRNPDPPTLDFLKKARETLKKQGFFLFAESLKSWKKKEKCIKSKEHRKREKKRKSKKARVVRLQKSTVGGSQGQKLPIFAKIGNFCYSLALIPNRRSNFLENPNLLK